MVGTTRFPPLGGELNDSPLPLWRAIPMEAQRRDLALDITSSKDLSAAVALRASEEPRSRTESLMGHQFPQKIRSPPKSSSQSPREIYK